MKSNILFVHTTGHWWDHRYFFKQMPALQKELAEITYLIKEDDSIEEMPFNLNTISKSKASWVRKTGGFNILNKLLKPEYCAIQLCNLELLPVGIFLSLFTRKKIFYDCREDHYHAMLHSKVWFPKWFRNLLGFGVKTLEFLASKTFTGFIDSDPAIYRNHRDMPKHKKMIFYNMALKSQFNAISRPRQKKYFFAVLGSMSVRTGVLDVIKAIAILKRDGYFTKLKLIGDPTTDVTLWKQIQDTISLNGLKDEIKITGRIPYFDIPKALSDCQVGIIPLLDLPKFRNNIATKQFEYMASEMPVIASYLPPQQIFIKENFNGLFYEPGNISELVIKMKSFLDDPVKAEKMGALAKSKTDKEWNSETQQEKYLEFYRLRLADKPYNETQLPPFKVI